MIAIPVEDAARMLYCSPRRVFQLLADGRLRRVRFGKLTLVGVESITALLAPPTPKGSGRGKQRVDGLRAHERTFAKSNTAQAPLSE